MINIRDFRRYSSLILVVLFLMCTFLVRAAISYPKPTSNKYLNDYAGVVDQSSSKQIIALGNEIEKQTGAQVVIVTINSLEGVPIEDYANGLFRKWGIGQAGKDNGVLILLAVKDKVWRNCYRVWHYTYSFPSCNATYSKYYIQTTKKQCTVFFNNGYISYRPFI